MAPNDFGPEEGASPSLTVAQNQQQRQPRALRGVFSHSPDGIASSGASFTTSDSASEEDYDELTSRPAEAMVLRQRRKGQTTLRKEVRQDADDAAEKTPQKASAPSLPLKSPKGQFLTPAVGLSQESPTSRNERGGRKLSATVIFEEKGSIQGVPISSATTAVSSTASIDGEAAGQKGGPGHSFVVSIDDPKLAEILRADLEHMREDLEEKRRLQQGPSEVEESVAGDGSVAGSTVNGETNRLVGSASSKPRHKSKKRRGRFSDFVFTRGFSTFDRQNADAASSPFHGFFTLFWISVFVFMVKIGAENWRQTGSPLGTNEIMANMVHHEIIVMLLSDGVLCALTGVSWLIQLIVFDGRLMEWDGAGWIVQNVWQTLYVAGFIGWTQLRDWPWSHTVFFVLHGLVMLMKQHSYAFYNGYLSSLYKRRAALQSRLEELHHIKLENYGNDQEVAWTSGRSASDAALASAARGTAVVDVAKKPSSHDAATSTVSPEALDKVVEALQSGQPLDLNQARVFERILHWELDGLTEELRGKSTRPDKAYPHNLTFTNHYEYIVLPTLVYELEYPRSETINWRYAAEKLVAVFGIIFVMIMISQAFMYPVVMRTVAMKEAGMPLAERFKEFPWMLSDLIFPFMMEYLLTWYLIWETILNFLAEITYFADRSFYSAWWNSVTWDEFARDWNRPVHLFLLRHVYHSSISAMKVNKHTATLITFFLSACVHELVMWCIFKKLRGYLLFLQMCQLPLVRLSRTKWMRHRQTLGNIMFWAGIFMGPTILCSLYLIL
ncbi:Sterol O-acyltransferase 2 (Sterol-ester synthase 2) [Sporothrix bragantina]|uniref:Sterol O-acyltransferase 2 (Sterol-ester synthase 2) n=1 Tax=Sporothrix bragantina TaxID=671064 RepID=A0ABP0ALY4_9PEZI